MSQTGIFQIVREKLDSLGQSHLMRYWEELSDESKLKLTHQVENLDPELFCRLKEFLLNPSLPKHKRFQSPRSIGEPLSNGERARELIRKGKVGVVLLAGGQASRLRLEGPKGCVPVTPVCEKTLFEYFAQKIQALQKKYDSHLHVAVMTSPLNHEATTTYFKKHRFFGLEKLTFFEQELYPLFDLHNFMFLETKDRFAEGPNGNGSFFRSFAKCGLLEKWVGEGVEHIQLLAIDNPLIFPLMEGDLEWHLEENHCVTLYGDHLLSDREKVGCVVDGGGYLTVIDYMEKEQGEIPGELFGNFGIYFLSVSFLQKVANLNLPLHCVKKVVPQLFEGRTIRPQEPNAWKFETFLFDAFEHSDKSGLLLVPRANCFAPLKNSRGVDSIDTVQRALYEKDLACWSSVLPDAAKPAFPFELHPAYHYMPMQLKEKTPYVEWP